jgi:hypothetical protein
MLEANYAEAVETRLRWLRWAIKHGDESWSKIADLSPAKVATRRNWLDVLPTYRHALESGDTFFVNKNFCELVEHARRTVPGDLVFDSRWLQSKFAWAWLETPFVVPANIDDGRGGVHTFREDRRAVVCAVAWVPIPAGQVTSSRVAGEGAHLFMTYQGFREIVPGSEGFGCWSYFVLQDGDRLDERVRAFEDRSRGVSGGLYTDRSENWAHEIRWVYAATYLMSQRLAMPLEKRVDRHVTKRAAKLKLTQPPILRVITLRRMEQDRPAVGHEVVDWQWRWEVRGHWRNQFCPGSGTYRPVFIEAYVKGPEGKPLKPPGMKLFVARR